MARLSYPSDLSDAEFEYLEPLLPTPRARGRPWAHPLPQIPDGIFYVVRTGWQWPQLPRECAPWPTVYWWWHRQVNDGSTRRGREAAPGDIRRPCSASSRQADDLSPGAVPIRQEPSPVRRGRVVAARAEVVAHPAERPQEAWGVFGRLEATHDSLPLARGLVRVLCRVVQPFAASMLRVRSTFRMAGG